MCRSFFYAVGQDKFSVYRFVQDSEKTKVIQSISSVIQALPPQQEVEPIDVRHSLILKIYNLTTLKAIVSPVVAKLAEALGSASQVCSFTPHTATFLA